MEGAPTRLAADLPHPPPTVRSIDAKLSTSQLPQATSPGLGTHQMPAIDASSTPISLETAS